MKQTITSLAVIALLGISVNANTAATLSKGSKSLTQFAQEQDDIDSGKFKLSDMGDWVDNSSLMIQKTPTRMEDLDKENISIKSLHEAVHTAQKEIKGQEEESKIAQQKVDDNKLQDQTFIQSAITNGKPEALNNDVNEALERHSDDLYKEDKNRDGRGTDRMGQWNKNYEDTYYQGHSQTPHTATGTVPERDQPHHIIPRSWDVIAPVNQPKHFNPGEYAPAASYTVNSASVGMSLAYFTVDTEEHARRFTKDLFRNGLVSAVTLEGTFNRSYLKFGQPTTETGRTRLMMHVTNDNVNKLIDYCNNNNPTLYDYPVGDIIVLPVINGNPEYISWTQTQSGSGAGLNQTYV